MWTTGGEKAQGEVCCPCRRRGPCPCSWLLHPLLMLLSYASPSWAGGIQHEGDWNPRATSVGPGTAIPDLTHTGQRHFLSGVQGLGPQVRHSESSLLTFLGPRVAPIPPFLLLSPPQAQLGASSVGGDLGVTLGTTVAPPPSESGYPIPPSLWL